MTVQEQRDALLDWCAAHVNHHVKPMTDDDGGVVLACFTCDPDDDILSLADVSACQYPRSCGEACEPLTPDADRLLALEAARDEWQTSSGYWSARTGEVMAANRALITDRDHLAAEVERLRLALRHILAWADLQPSGWIDYIANECHQHLDGEPARALLAGEVVR